MMQRQKYIVGNLLFLFSFLLLLVPAAFAQPTVGGANCTTNIVAQVPNGVDWKSVFIIRGADGSAWQRGIISNGARGEFLLKELAPTKIYGTAAPDADVQIFLFSPRKNASGGLLKPDGQGTCFMADTTWMTDPEKQDNIEMGYFELPISAKFLWPVIGQEMVFDVFYKLEESWDQLAANQQYRGGQNFFIGTHIAPTTLKIDGEWDDAECTKACEDGPAIGVTLDPAKLSSKYLGSNFSAVNQQRVTIERMPGVHTFYAGYAAGTTNPADKPALRAITHKAVAMEIVKRALIAHENVVGSPPGLPAISAQHLQTAAFGSLPVSLETQRLARYLAVLMIGDRGVNPIDGAINIPGLPEPPPELPGGNPNLSDNPLPTPPNLPGGPNEEPAGGGNAAVTPSPIPMQTQRPPFVPAIPRPPIPPPPQINFLAGVTLTDSQAALNTLLNLGENEGLLTSVFPTGISTLQTWSSDLVTLISFWTGGLQPNLCLLANDTLFAENFQDQNAQFSAFQCEERLPYVSGVTPLLVLNNQDELVLEPDFRQAAITSSQTEFDNNETWLLPAGIKQPIDYHYTFTSPFSVRRVGEMCAKTSQFPELITTLENQFTLSPAETAALAQELYAVTPQTSDFVQLRFADSVDIATRIAWRGDGQKLDIAQLFFEINVGSCDKKSLSALPLSFDHARDGFEVGLLK